MFAGRRRLVGSLTLVVTLLAALALVPAGATAAGSRLGHWHGPSRLRPAGHGVVTALSCGSPTTCRVVDDAGATSRFQGRFWSVPQDADRSWGPLADISCPTAHFCAAVGDGIVSMRSRAGWRTRRTPGALGEVSCGSARFCLAGTSGDGLRRWTGSRWHRVRHVPRWVRFDSGLRYSCVGSHVCLGVDARGLAFRYHRGTWRHAGRLPEPLDVETSFGDLSISCSAPRACMAATDGDPDDASSADVAWRYHHGSWAAHVIELSGSSSSPHRATVSCGTPTDCVIADSQGVTVHMAAGAWGPVTPLQPSGPDGSVGPWLLSCPAAGDCVAVDQERHTYVLDGDTWRRTKNYYGPLSPHLRVSCVSSHFCMTLDGPGHARRWTGMRWVKARTRPGGGNPVILALSCTSPTFCRALEPARRVLSWNGHVWTRPHALPPGDWDLLSCAGARLCLAADTSDPGGGIVAWDGSSWTPAPAAPFQVATLSCVPHGGACVAGGLGPAVSTYDGTSWSPPLVVDAGDPSDSVAQLSCPRTGFCMAQLTPHLGPTVLTPTLYERNGTWEHPFEVTDFTELSCSPSRLCIAGAGGGLKAFTALGRSSKITRIGPPGYAAPSPATGESATSTGLSCGAAGFCVDVDQLGNAFVRLARHGQSGSSVGRRRGWSLGDSNP